MLPGPALRSFTTHSRRDAAEANIGQREPTDIGQRAPGPRFDEIAVTIWKANLLERTRLISSMN
jgi:hypothetical protein